MTTKTITIYSSGGYSLAPGYSELDITKAAGFGGGVYIGHYATVSNAGTINSTTTIGSAIGLLFGTTAGGVVINRPTGSIYGRDFGVFSDTKLKLENYGTIASVTGAVVEANTGGSVTNGNYAHLDATIAGPSIRLLGTPGTVTNFGTITAFVFMNDGGYVTNGGVEDATALMNGGGGIYVAGAAGTVSNFATIQAYGSPGHNGINLGAGGRVTNGAVSDTAARIVGYTGVLLSGYGTVRNFGVIDGTGPSTAAYGALLGKGGFVTNGGGLDTSALIEGYTGVKIGGGAGFVTNYGTIEGLGLGPARDGVYIGAGGGVTNGGDANRTALIEGYDGVTGNGTTRVDNFGTIFASGRAGVGVYLAQGALVNGRLNDGVALVEGFDGASLSGFANSANYGTILGLGELGSFGVGLSGTAALVNGAAGHVAATVQGFYGVEATGTANTVTNFGTIAGAGGTAVLFKSAQDALIVEAGCVFVGQVLGDGGTLDLAGGTGTLTGLGSGNVTVSGSIASTPFTNFDTVEIGAGATFSTSGAVSIASGVSVVSAGLLTMGTTKNTVANAGLVETSGAGSLTIQGALSNTGTLATMGGTLTVNGAVTGAGMATINGGALDFASAFNQNVTFTKTGTLELAQSQSYTATIAGFSKTGGTSLDLVDIAFGGGTTASYSGTKTGGVLTVTDGTHTAHINLKGNYLNSTFVAASDGHGGTIVHDPKAAPSPHLLIAAMAGMGVAGAGLAPVARFRPHPPPTLVGPHAAIA